MSGIRVALLSAIILLCSNGTLGFSPIQTSRVTSPSYTSSSQPQQVELISLQSTRLSLRQNDEDENRNVAVNIIPDLDPATLTAIGFGLIAFNFFVLGNSGDGGLGGIIARFINTFY